MTWNCVHCISLLWLKSSRTPELCQHQQIAQAAPPSKSAPVSLFQGFGQGKQRGAPFILSLVLSGKNPTTNWADSSNVGLQGELLLPTLHGCICSSLSLDPPVYWQCFLKYVILGKLQQASAVCVRALNENKACCRSTIEKVFSDIPLAWHSDLPALLTLLSVQDQLCDC